MRAALSVLSLLILLSGCAGSEGITLVTVRPCPDPGPDLAAPHPPAPRIEAGDDALALAARALAWGHAGWARAAGWREWASECQSSARETQGGRP